MEISGLEEYGLRCALRLAQVYSKNRSISASEIAQLEGISTEYASKFMFLLRKGGLVQAHRGAKGGFALNCAPHEISLKQVFEALHTKPYPAHDFCTKHTGQLETCVHVGGCSVRPIWSTLTLFWIRFLESIQLSELLVEEASVQKLISERWVNVVQFKYKTQEAKSHVQAATF